MQWGRPAFFFVPLGISLPVRFWFTHCLGRFRGHERDALWIIHGDFGVPMALSHTRILESPRSSPALREEHPLAGPINVKRQYPHLAPKLSTSAPISANKMAWRVSAASIYFYIELICRLRTRQIATCDRARFRSLLEYAKCKWLWIGASSVSSKCLIEIKMYGRCACFEFLWHKIVKTCYTKYLKLFNIIYLQFN